MTPKKIETRENLSSPLHPGTPDPKKILKEARQHLSSTPSGNVSHPSTLEIPESSQFLPPAFDPHSKKGKEELDSLFTPSQVENFQVFTNPLLSEEVKAEAVQTGSSSLFSSHIPFTGRVLPHQPKSNNFPPSSKISSSN